MKKISLFLVTLMVTGGLTSFNAFAMTSDSYNDYAVADQSQVQNNSNTDWASMINSSELPSMTNELLEYMAENPGLSDAEYNKYFKGLIIENYDSSDKASISISKKIFNKSILKRLPKVSNLKIIKNTKSISIADALPIVKDFGPTEKAVFNSNPYKGAICCIDGDTANKLQHSLWNGNGDDNADAFRHCVWQALSTHHVGADYSKKMADAHEKDHYVELPTKMDLYNNIIGREIGAKIYNTNDAIAKQQIKDNVLKAVKTGKCRRFYGADIGRLKYLVSTNSNGLK